MRLLMVRLRTTNNPFLGFAHWAAPTQVPGGRFCREHFLAAAEALPVFGSIPSDEYDALLVRGNLANFRIVSLCSSM